MQEATEGRQTIKVSDPNKNEGCTVCKTSESKEHPRPKSFFRGAAADGSKVFFTIGTTAVGAEKPPLGEDATENLYMYDLDPTPTLPSYMNGQHLVNLTAAGEQNGQKTARVSSFVRGSSDGSHVYFIAQGVLTTEKNSEGQEAEPSHENLYGVDTETGKVKFIAVAPNTGTDEGQGPNPKILAQTTTDGRYLVFDSTADLAGASNCKDKANVCHRAVYLYDFQTGQLTWLSRPAAGSEAGEAQDAFVSERYEFQTGGYADTNDFQRDITGCPAEAALTEISGCAKAGEHDGEDVIFSTEQHLQAGPEGTAPQLYLWHCPATAGGEPCPNPGAEGEVHLISDGRSSSELTPAPQGGVLTSAAISASGSDIFFLTATPLVGQDTDQLYDYYDARIDGGYPAPMTESGCAGEGCQPPPPPPGSFGAAGSSLIPAGGNLGPPSASVLTFHASKPKPLTRSQKLARALRACRTKDHSQKRRRQACERQAHKSYGPAAKAKRTAGKSKHHP